MEATVYRDEIVAPARYRQGRGARRPRLCMSHTNSYYAMEVK